MTAPAVLAVIGVLAGLALAVGPASEMAVDRGAYSSKWLALAIGWNFVAAGFYASIRRPSSRTGLLMIAVGLAWLASSAVGSVHSVVHTVGLFSGMLWAALLIHMTLSFPSGYLGTRANRRLVIAGYGVTTVLQVPPLLFSAHMSLTCEDCPRHLAVIDDNPSVADALFALQLIAALGVVMLGCHAVASRWRQATPPERRALAPVLWAAGATGVVSIAAVVTQMSGHVRLSADIDWAYLSLLASIPLAFLIGLLRSRLRRADAVAAFVERLARAPAPDAVRHGLAEALGDPSLAVVYWLPDEECWVDAAARPVELPDVGSSRAMEVIELNGSRVAAIVHDASLSDEPELVRTAGAAARLGLERERLEAALRAHILELSASRTRIIEAGDAERRRVERDLHDGAQQRLVSLLLTLRLARRNRQADPDATDALLDQVERDLTDALGDLRDLAQGILPPALTDRGLGAAVQELARRCPITVSIDEMPDRRLPDSVETAAYFVIAEALTNAVKHAHTDHARIRASVHDGCAVVQVADSGIGGADDNGSGVRGLADRVGALHGRLEVRSEPGQGTTLRAVIPIDTATGEAREEPTLRAFDQVSGSR